MNQLMYLNSYYMRFTITNFNLYIINDIYLFFFYKLTYHNLFTQDHLHIELHLHHLHNHLHLHLQYHYYQWEVLDAN